MKEYLQMHMKSKTTHLQIIQLTKRKNAIRCNTPHLCPEHPETRVHCIYMTLYAIGRYGLVHRRKAVIFSPLTSALTETKCKNDLLSREKTTTPYTNIFRVRSRQLCSIIQNRVMLPRYIHMYFQNNNIQIKFFILNT